ncbi:hypothetical protein [Sphingomonas sp. Leaf257]|uniref:hypothetical protein n=1 Tax=Sphingomonas sp. Leaf257 TaxID=1736309 RepID=UPI0006FEA341|nr:hypothetical protein [Sphingomonas sp. Leaf257]KQO57690.1 hypothetical protein ASF14_14755 [Sphingomonas sp. Leaf257]
MKRVTQTELDQLPHTFTLKTARKMLQWQGATAGLARMLLASGFCSADARQGQKPLWIRLESAAAHRQRMATAAFKKSATAMAATIARAHADRAAVTAAKAMASQSPAECACQCHENTCGAADMDMAERTLCLITSLRPIGADMVDRLDELVRRAGPAHARAFLTNFSPDDGVPF